MISAECQQGQLSVLRHVGGPRRVCMRGTHHEVVNADFFYHALRKLPVSIGVSINR